MKRILWFMASMAFVAGCSKDDSGEGSKTIDGWTISRIDDVSAGNGEINAVCDGNNKLHVLYTDFNESIKYATNATGSWVKTTLATEDGNNLIGGDHGIAIDGNNHVHMVYATATNEMPGETRIYYATDKSGSMETENIYTAEGSCSGMDIEATPDGHAHIVFGDENMHLMYRNNLSGSWTSSMIDSYWTSAEPSMALDSDDNLYVAYFHGWDGVLKLQLINAAGNLVSNHVLDDSGDTGWSPSIFIDPSDDAVFISYWDYLLEKTKLYNNGTIEEVETSTWSEGGIAADQNGDPHMTYIVGNVLKQAVRNAEGFDIEILPDQASSNPSDIVIDTNGKIYIVYPSGSTWDLCVMSK